MMIKINMVEFDLSGLYLLNWKRFHDNLITDTNGVIFKSQ